MQAAKLLIFPMLMLTIGTACDRISTPLLPELADPCVEWPEPGVYRLFVGDAWTRTPLVVIPPKSSRRDAVVMLHGAGGSPDRIQALTSWAALSSELGLVSVFPSGTGGTGGLTWNAGTCCGYAESIDQPDVAFLTASAKAAREQLCLDHVLAAGHSNGSMMVERWTCEGGGIDAAISSSGPLLTDTCVGEPSPVQMWHGDADPRVPFNGGTTSEGEAFPPATEAFARVRARNGCTDAAPTVTVDGDLTCETWSCEAPTAFCRIAGWGHDWPGGVNDRGTNPRIEDVGLDWVLDMWDAEEPNPEAPDDTDLPN